MRYARVAAVCLVLGVVLFAAGAVSAPGWHQTGECFVRDDGERVRTTERFGDGHLERIGPRYVIWDDGCNLKGISTISVIGGLLFAAGAVVGGVGAANRHR